MIRSHTIRVWLESPKLPPDLLPELTGLLGPVVVREQAGWDWTVMQLPVEATSPGKALILGVQAVDAAINLVCPSLAGSGLGANWRRA